MTTETGAGQWGTALSEACSYFGLDLQVYMVKVSYNQKPFRKDDHEDVWRTGLCISIRPDRGRQQRSWQKTQTTAEALDALFQEAVEVAVTNEGYRYVLGSVLNQVLLHQSIIGLESKIAMEQLGRVPGHRHRMCRRRFQPGRPHRAVHAGQTDRQS